MNNNKLLSTRYPFDTHLLIKRVLNGLNLTFIRKINNYNRHVIL
jgi:hypothetical protein